MKNYVLTSLWLAAILYLSGCSSLAVTPSPSAAATFPVSQLTPVQEADRQSNGGGEPRSANYWLIWNSCTPGNMSETARSNGGRAAGWVILDDLLQEPGILIARQAVTTCAEAANLLQGRDLDGGEMANDAAYVLATQLLVAQLNLAAGAETCPAIEKDVQIAQLALLGLDFAGRGAYLPPGSPPDDLAKVAALVVSLSSYNSGDLCR